MHNFFDKSDFLEFNDLSAVTYVTQEKAVAVRDKPVMTDGISRCAVLILQNRASNACLFFHLGPDSISKFCTSLNDYWEMFLLEPGEKIGIFIENLSSFSREWIAKLLRDKGVEILSPIRIDCDSPHSAVAFRPLTNEILCYTNKVTIYTPAGLSYLAPSVPSFADRVDQKIQIRTRFDEYRWHYRSGHSIDTQLEKFAGFLDLPMIMEDEKLCKIITSFLELLKSEMLDTALDMSTTGEQYMRLLDLEIQYIAKYAAFREISSEFVMAYIDTLRWIKSYLNNDTWRLSDMEMHLLIEKTQKLAGDYPEVSEVLMMRLRKITAFHAPEEAHASSLSMGFGR